MEDTLRALGGILLNAVPTFVLVILIHFYLKYVFFRPLKRVLDARYAATEGARKLAEESLSKAEAKTAEYQAAMRAARAEVYHAQEEFHRNLQEERAAQVQAARAQAEALIKSAHAELARDLESAKGALAGESDLLASRIAEAILKRRLA